MTQQYELPPLPEGLQALPPLMQQWVQRHVYAAIEADRKYLAAEYRKELDKVSTRNYELRMENAQLRADRQRRGEPVAWRTYDRNGWYVFSLTKEDAERDFPGGDHKPLYTAPQPDEPVKVPRLYQHDDGRYGLSFGPARFTEGNPAWHRLPIDVTETQEET